MTEISDIRKTPLWPQRAPKPRNAKRYAIDPTAFAVAVVGAPLLVTAMTFWIAFVPVIALVLGGPVYLAFAVPVLMWDMQRREPNAWRYVCLGFFASAAFAAFLALVHALTHQQQYETYAYIYGVFGAAFGPLWAAPVASLYRKLRRADFARPLPPLS
ncbi:MAG: hypothetical protein AAGL89_14495 [Pseudomonadota bacterium]